MLFGLDPRLHNLGHDSGSGAARRRSYCGHRVLHDPRRRHRGHLAPVPPSPASACTSAATSAFGTAKCAGSRRPPLNAIDGIFANTEPGCPGPRRRSRCCSTALRSCSTEGVPPGPVPLAARAPSSCRPASL
ncbi:hypothetical protein HBB16_21925 [Pseudonocardia sp. MCCB 268]|nr:hypothetical protein [Pseudonocardia cytotoxica]